MKASVTTFVPSLRRVTQQPLIAIGTAIAASIATGVSLLAFPALSGLGSQVAIASALALALLATRNMHLHLHSGFKLKFGSVPLFLMAALLAPPIAIVTAGVARFAREWNGRRTTGLFVSDIVTDVSRWMLVVAAASFVAHAGFGYTAFAAATIMVAGDVLTSPLVLSPIMGKHPLQVISLVGRDAGLPEVAQYVVAVGAALVALHSLWLLAGFAFAAALLVSVWRRPSLHLSARVAVAITALVANIAAAHLMGGRASADIGPCRTDPIVVLSNGTVVDLSATVMTGVSNVENVTYVLHAPVGTTVKHVTYTAGESNIETLRFYADDAANTYDTSTTVSLGAGSADVIAKTRVSSVGQGSAAGNSASALSVHLAG